MQEMTLKDNQLVETMDRLDAKNAKMAELVAQFTALNRGGGSGGREANQPESRSDGQRAY